MLAEFARKVFLHYLDLATDADSAAIVEELAANYYTKDTLVPTKN